MASHDELRRLAGRNPVEQRVDRLRHQWLRFASDPEARLLCWHTDSQGRQLVEAFVRTEQEEVGEVPALFLSFGQPFLGDGRDGLRLRDQLVELYRAEEEALRDDSRGPWHCPAPHPDEDGVSLFLRCCQSFAHHHRESIPALAIALLPSEVRQSRAWTAWRLRLCRARTPSRLRFLCVEVAEGADESPRPLDDEGLWWNLDPQLRTEQLPFELLTSLPAAGPSHQLRLLLLAQGQAAQAGQSTLCRHLGQQALELATAQGWPAQAAVVHLIQAVGSQAAGEGAQALAGFRLARGAAGAAAAEGESASASIGLQALLGEGSQLLAEQRYQAAAEIYTEAAEVARESKDALLELESYRLAATAWELAGESARSWRSGSHALRLAEAQDEPVSAEDSSLPWLGQLLCRLSGPSGPMAEDLGSDAAGRRHRRLQQRLEALLGQNWDRVVRDSQAGVDPAQSSGLGA